MAEGATTEQIDAAERAVGLRFPDELRRLLSATNGSESWYGEIFLMIYGTESIVAVHQEIPEHDGLLVFASDGSRELIGFDTRRSPSTIVMIDVTSSGWSEAILQAGSLDEFLQQRERGEDFRWEASHSADG